MEFENLGAHCQYDGCNQKDFLPFKCDHCQKYLCLLHRSYVSHDCSGGKAKDMTSMDCPICGKSVRFDKGQDENVVWNDHYVHSCSQQASSHVKKPVKCFKPECHTTLGPSNTFTCGKCHQRVCLAHRIPEEHSCVGYIRADFLDKVQKRMAVGNAERTKKPAHKEVNHVSMFMPPGKNDHKHHHHAKEPAAATHSGVQASPAFPPPPPASTSHSAPSKNPGNLSCPFCGLSHEDDASLIGHIAAFHPDNGSMPLPPPPPPPSASAGSNSSNSATHREVCPVCHARFPDAIALVRHFEGSHSDRAQQQRPPAPPQQGRGGEPLGKPSDCVLS